MIVFSMRVRTTPKGKRDLIKTVVPLIGPVFFQPGCLNFNVYQDAEEAEVMMLEQKWETREDFDRHVRSPDFKRILAAMELATEKPEVSFYEVETAHGLNDIEKHREEGQTMRNMRNKKVFTLFLFALCSLALVFTFALTPVAVAEEGASSGQQKEGIGDTGTDPRDFAPKFMPYYRYTELKNGLKQHEMVLFGLIPLSKKIALTYEIPLAKEVDVKDTALRDPATGLCGGLLSGGGVVLPNGLPGEGDCEETGVGDMNLRLIAKTPWNFLGGEWMLQTELWFPTATDPTIGSETFRLAPGFTYVKDIGFWPAPGAFFALMNFYDFDVFGESSRGDVSMYKGRWFFMLPLHPSGIYTLPEIQPVYDFENDHFSLWIGPEIGKLLAPGRIVYAKPGFGISPDADAGDREWSFELGFRWFF
jgi:quinol monooxygenase YgiN